MIMKSASMTFNLGALINTTESRTRTIAGKHKHTHTRAHTQITSSPEEGFDSAN